jgi:hypothetical protein
MAMGVSPLCDGVVLGKPGERLASARSDENRVLHSGATGSGTIHAGLDRHDLADGQLRVGSWSEDRCLVDLQADPMARTVQ